MRSLFMGKLALHGNKLTIAHHIFSNLGSSFLKRGIISKSPQEVLLSAFQKEIKQEDRFCLTRLEDEWCQSQPFRGKKILVNVHMTLITLTMIRILLNAGGQVEIMLSPELARHDNAMKALEEAGIPFLDPVPEHKEKFYYDIVFDCGAGTKKIIPTIGKTELTYTVPEIYKDIKYPVITVDNSKTKEIETGFGTGDSLVRVLNDLVRKTIATSMMCIIGALNNLNFGITELENKESNRLLYLSTFLRMVSTTHIFRHNKFMVFGYGKVGKGIVHALESAGTRKKNIFIVEESAEAFMTAMKAGYTGIFNKNPENVQKIKEKIPKMWAVITATGVEGAISKNFTQNDFDPFKLLINMGTSDEFGRNFATERILNQKKPANFMLNYPTEVIYLDPIFTIFLQAGKQLMTDPGLVKGLNNFSKKLDIAILGAWMERHGEDVWRHRIGQVETESLLQHLRTNPDSSEQKLYQIFDSRGIFHKPKALTPLICLNKTQTSNSLQLTS